MSNITIREATKKDSNIILGFIRELAKYEKAEHEVIATESSIADSLFNSESSTKAIVCEKNGTPIGFAVYFFNYSTWLGKHGLYLEDLYVSSAERGSGAGKSLLKYLAQLAVSKGCGRFEWSVIDWNQPAIKFYDSLGAKPQNEWIAYRLS
jgi:GNAT superfamily N-acetyltransferase